MATWAQHVITCDICEEPAKQFCNSCQVNLCAKCVSRHVEESKTSDHNIVALKNKRVLLVFPGCMIHSIQRCEAYCNKCNIPICIKCSIGRHRGHDAIGLDKKVAQKKHEVEQETKEIEGVIKPRYSSADEDLTEEIKSTTAKFSELEKEKERLRSLWHKEVNNMFDHFGSMIQSRKDRSLKALTLQQTQLRQQIPIMDKIVKQNKQIQRTNKASEVVAYKSRLQEFRYILKKTDVKIPSFRTNTDSGNKLSLEIEEINLTMKKAKIISEEPEYAEVSVKGFLHGERVIATVPTKYTPLWRVVCVGATEAWVAGERGTITRIDIHGVIQNTVGVNIRNVWADTIAVTKNEEVLYSNVDEGTVNILRYGKPRHLITIEREWRPHRICSTVSGDFLLHSSCNKYNKIVRYHGRRPTQEIFVDAYEMLIFGKGRFPLDITENATNEDVCVSDYNSHTVVVLDRRGKLRFRYDGTMANRLKPFSPGDIVTNPCGQIIVTDIHNDCLHVLNRDGEFLRCLVDCGLDRPCGLSIDSEGRLWVGQYNTGDIKIIQNIDINIETDDV